MPSIRIDFFDIKNPDRLFLHLQRWHDLSRFRNFKFSSRCSLCRGVYGLLCYYCDFLSSVIVPTVPFFWDLHAELSLMNVRYWFTTVSRQTVYKLAVFLFFQGWSEVLEISWIGQGCSGRRLCQPVELAATNFPVMFTEKVTKLQSIVRILQRDAPTSGEHFSIIQHIQNENALPSSQTLAPPPPLNHGM